MLLKRRDTEEQTWCKFDKPITVELLLVPMTGLMDAEYQDQIGAQPQSVETKLGDDGSISKLLQMSFSKKRAYHADLWIMGEIIKGVKGEFDDGTPLELNEEFFKLIRDAGALPEILKKARELGAAFVKAVEGNSPSLPSGSDQG